MSVKVYVGRDSQGQPWPPDYAHEARPDIDIVKRLWLAYNSQKLLYAVAANLHRPSADLVILSERGIGIVELKHYPGRIWCKGSTWYAGEARIKAGSESKGRRNPHEQVQDYAAEIRSALIQPTRQPYLPGLIRDWEAFKFHTAVCFTHPDARIDDFRRALRRSPPNTRPWEKFDVLRPDEIPEWAAALRFEVDKGRPHGYEPHRLAPKQIVRIVERLLRGTEWTEILNLMPTGEPYAYLTLIEGRRRTQVFSLDREEMTLGRDVNVCDISVPEQYSRVGREHARIWRELGKIFIEDLGSTNGTYVNQLRIRRPQLLKRGMKIALGGPVPGEKVCLLEFSVKAPLEPSVTEIDTGSDLGANRYGES